MSSDDGAERALKQAEDDDLLISQLLNGDGGIEDKLSDLFSRDLEPGEKAEDAVDYEDFSDGELASDLDEVPSRPTAKPDSNVQEDPDLDDIFSGDPDDDQFDHLFGGASPPKDGDEGDDVESPKDDSKSRALSDLLPFHPIADLKPAPVSDVAAVTSPASKAVETDLLPPLSSIDEDDPETKEQLELFRRAREECEERMARAAEFAATQRTGGFPTSPHSWNELFESVWPQFDPDERPYFNRLFAQKRAYYTGKVPVKPPKPIHPSKVSLELAPDQERAFRLPGPARDPLPTRIENANTKGITIIEESKEDVEEDSEIDLSDIDWTEDVGGIKMQELAMLCEDLDLSPPVVSPVGQDEDDGTLGEPPKKFLKTGGALSKPVPVFFDKMDSLENPEATTARFARRVIIEDSDPYLLLDQRVDEDTETKSRIFNPVESRTSNLPMKDWILRRYNISNDSAYDLLKDSHSNRVRSNLANLAVEHSLPAIKLQYPFFKVKLSPRESRTVHRPKLKPQPNALVQFTALRTVKRKNLKGKSAQQIFSCAKDLNVGDNSTTILLEYSEEYPSVLSNFGMASRLINYYRKQDSDDTNRPKLDVGETVVLLPEDKSPFSIFGTVDPGQQIPTVHNAMFRAPVFKHTPKSTDFLISRSTTGVYGSEWYIRPLDHIFVVGQQFPSVEIPGIHSRKVTEASKRRLRMISYRVYDRYIKRGKTDPDVSPLTNEIIRTHLPGTDVAQNRGKMREFMQYDKETCTWVLKKGDSIPDMQTLRSWIKPEDVCFLDSMQVGHRQLLDAGYQQDDVGEDERDGMSLEQKLAPWNTSKNFLHACQGKAMLELHGEGDPSRRGEAFSFIKTSMKGGFKPIGESIEDRLDAKRLKENGGHTYNVAKQQRAYHDAIRRIWDAQKLSLGSSIEQDELEQGVDEYTNDASGSAQLRLRNGRVDTFSHLRRDDDSVSQFSRFSTNSQRGKTLKINRTIKSATPGQADETEEVVITDPKVIKEYLRRRRQMELNSTSLHDLQPTGDPEVDAHQQKRLLDELARLERNKERRHTREKAKGMRLGNDLSAPGTPGSSFNGPLSATLSVTESSHGMTIPGTPLSTSGTVGATTPFGSSSKPQGTQRRCANCGQVGHIKTNKKLCPMLNGKMKPADGLDQAAFGPSDADAVSGEARPA